MRPLMPAKNSAWEEVSRVPVHPLQDPPAILPIPVRHWPGFFSLFFLLPFILSLSLSLFPPSSTVQATSIHTAFFLSLFFFSLALFLLSLTYPPPSSLPVRTSSVSHSFCPPRWRVFLIVVVVASLLRPARLISTILVGVYNGKGASRKERKKNKHERNTRARGGTRGWLWISGSSVVSSWIAQLSTRALADKLLASSASLHPSDHQAIPDTSPEAARLAHSSERVAAWIKASLDVA